jgi:SAM-dependent methyltransferase
MVSIMGSIKEFIKKVLPESCLVWNKRRKLLRLRKANMMVSTKDVFTKIYTNNIWGGEAGSFYSGSGSQFEVAQKYCEMVKDFITKHDVKTILDLGCGDFNVGKNLQLQGTKYIGIDIVQPLVDRNINEFGTNNIEFRCMNMIEDDLPEADLVLVRQVLQHLSNDQILRVLNKLKKYPFVLVTEHYPAEGGNIVPNIDKPHGSDTRLVDNSAVYLDKPPFNVLGIKVVLNVNALDGEEGYGDGERIKTVLLSNA